MKLFFAFTLLVICLTQQVFAQQDNEKSFILNSKIATTESSKMKHDLLFLLTNGNPKLLSEIHLKFTVYSRFYLQKTSYSTSEIYFELSKLHIGGDTVYRSFSLKNSLQPDCFVGHFSLNNNGELLQKKSFVLNQIAVKQAVRIGFSDFDEFQSTELHGSIDEFNFSAEAFENIENHVSIINNYWATSLLLDSLKTEIEQKNITNSNDLPDLFVFWDKTRKAVIIAEESVDNSLLELNQHDPAGLIEKMKQFERLNIRFLTLFEKELGKSDKANFEVVLVEKFLQSLQQYRIASKKVGFYDSNVFYQFSLLKPDQAMVEQINRMSQYAVNNTVAQQIYNGLKETAFDMFANDDLASAIAIFTDLKLLEKLFPDILRDETIDNTFIKAKEGLLNSYLQIASRAMLANNIEMAAMYHHKAEEFRKKYYAENQLENISDITGNLVSAYYEKGIDFIDKNQTYEAISMMEKALHTSITFGNQQFTDKIEEKLRSLHQKIYIDMVNEAEKSFEEADEAEAFSINEKALIYRDEHLPYLELSTEAIMLQRKMKQPVLNRSIEYGISSAQKGQAREALEAYNNARTIADEFGLEINTPIDSLTISAAKPVIIQTIRSANSKVWANEMNAALNIYSEAKEMQQKYHLEADSAIQDEFSRLDHKMIQQACINHKMIYNEYIDKIEKAIRQNRYDDLAANLQAALELGEQNQGCMIEMSKAITFRDKYQKLLEYNKRYNEVMQVMYSQGFGESLKFFEKLDQDIHLFNLDEYGIIHQTVILFIENQSNSGLTRIALQYFLLNNNISDALKCFALFQNQTLLDEDAEQLHQSLARLLAERDAEIQQELPPESLAFNYFGQEKRNKSLRQTYLRSYRNLKSKN